MAHQDYGPAEYGCREVSAKGELDKADGPGEAGGEVAEVEGAATPGVLLAVEVCVCLDSHYCGIP